ncbi:hypothetical protein ABI953_18380 [Bacillus paralicheniformis]|uniref:hypothetical protein n=1 Tax=Bacillus paralicheniformis TaxID=1648923 RepID=UPI003D1A834F
MIFLVRLICLSVLACLALLLILNYAPFLAMPVWIALIIALIVCLYLAFKEERRNGEDESTKFFFSVFS